jgi:predicted RNase H-like HicB family nuclease
MLSEYIGGALRKARYEILADNGSFYVEIPGFDGVFANAPTIEECREELREVIEEWILFRVSRTLALPSVDGRELTIRAIA